MARMTAKDFPQELLELYDFYAHGRITKREFLDRAAKFAVGGMTALALLKTLSPDYALAQQVAFTDPEILAEYITYPSPGGHGEVRGYPGNDERGRELQREVDPGKLMNDFFAAVEFLLASDMTTGKVGITGFCYGGGVSNAAAVAYPELAAAVPFYGRQAPPEDVPKIAAPLLLHFAEQDENVNAGWPAYEAALKEHGKTYEAHVYPGTNHGFHNDSTPRYDEAAAKLAWERTLQWFGRYLA